MERSDTEKLFFARLLGLQKCLIMQNTCIYFLFIPYFSTINVRLIANIFYQKTHYTQTKYKENTKPHAPLALSQLSFGHRTYSSKLKTKNSIVPHQQCSQILTQTQLHTVK